MTLEERKARIRKELEEIIDDHAEHTRDVMKRLVKAAENLGSLTEEDT